MTASSVLAPNPIDDLGVLVRAILQRKSGMSLRMDDARPANVDALEVFQDVMARMWERLGGWPGERPPSSRSRPSPVDWPAYAAAVAHNAWSDHLRERHPRRARMKSRLRYFLGSQGRFGQWQSPQGDTLAGPCAWRFDGRAPASFGALASFNDGRSRLHVAILPLPGCERLQASDWDRLLGALFDAVQAPIELDALVGVVATLCGLEEDRYQSIEALDDDGDRPVSAPGAAADPERQAEMRSVLRELWSCIGRLKLEHRRAYLLNLPGPEKSRADIEVFVLHGIASAEDIAAALDLDPRQWALLERELAALGTRPPSASATQGERLVWLLHQLPLPDALIGRMLGLGQQQVINRRLLAMRELARLMERSCMH